MSPEPHVVASCTTPLTMGDLGKMEKSELLALMEMAESRFYRQYTEWSDGTRTANYAYAPDPPAETLTRPPN